MTMTDPIADLLTRIRNINCLGRTRVSAPYSRIKQEILNVLKREGFITGFEVAEDGAFKKLDITLKFGPEGEKVIRTIDRISSPGCRVFKKVKEIKPVLEGQGIAVISTPRGVLSDREARAQNVGGEILCNVY
jgi:small subunit ribosomal protein S8